MEIHSNHQYYTMALTMCARYTALVSVCQAVIFAAQIFIEIYWDNVCIPLLIRCDCQRAKQLSTEIKISSHSFVEINLRHGHFIINWVGLSYRKCITNWRIKGSSKPHLRLWLLHYEICADRRRKSHYMCHLATKHINYRVSNILGTVLSGGTVNIHHKTTSSIKT